MGCGSSVQVSIENINQKPVSISVIGLSNAGKTSLIEFLIGEYSQNDPPVHTNGILIRDISVNNILYRFYDIGGIGTATSDLRECISKSNAVFYVCDQVSLEANVEILKDFFRKTAPFVVEKGLPTVVIVTKAKASTARTQSIEQLTKPFLGSLKKYYISISKLNDSVYAIFEWLETIISAQNI